MSEAQQDPSKEGLRGWTALAEHLQGKYPGQEPIHLGSLIPSYLGGSPTDAIEVFRAGEPVPHWHFATFALSDLFDRGESGSEISGYGYEFTFRLRRDAQEETPPDWAINFLQNLVRATVEYNSIFDVNHTIDANGPIALDSETELTAIAFALDPTWGEIDTPNGRLKFLQIVAMTADELSLAQDLSTATALKLIAGASPLWVTDLSRRSVLADPAVAADVQRQVEQHGSKSEGLHITELRWSKSLLGRSVTMYLGAGIVPSLLRLIRGRTLHDKPFGLWANDVSVIVTPGPTPACEIDGADLHLTLTPDLAREILATLPPKRGQYAWPALPKFTLTLEPTEIRDADGNVTQTVG